MEAYLDNSATTRCTDAVKEVVVRTMMEDYGNPSSKHMKGVEAERYLRDARETIARTLKVNEKEIYFTSGATESNNWALIGAATANRRAGMHIITTAIEHPAVLMPLQYLEEQGFRVTYLPVDERGHISLQDLEAAVCEDTILVSMMYVNNEIGTIEPIAEAAKIVKKHNPRILFHVDAVQAYGKLAVYPKKLGIDLLSVSAHKIHGPKGIGFLYVNEKAKIHPLLLGGGQQKGMRSGTDNVPGAAGLAQAAKEAYEHLEENTQHLLSLKQRMTAGLTELSRKLEMDEAAQGKAATGKAVSGKAATEKADPGKAGSGKTGPGKGGQELKPVVIHSEEGEKSAPHIVSAAFPGVRSEVLLHALEERRIYVSAGSACSSNKKLPVSAVLKELHLRPELLESTLRFSFSRYTTQEEIDYCLQVLAELLPVLRRYARY
ncbi:MAG: cysteine desulfurase family protein [Lachnospiraceae bacterium]|nr:cysteine desulfurase family protein [Lachnospiraceae bacterium]